MRARSTIRGLALGCGLLLTAGPAEAISLLYDFTGPDHTSPDFSPLVGDAFWVNDAGLSPPLRLRLTDNGGGRQGSAWYNASTIAPEQAWNAEFTFQNTFGAFGGADGVGFHLHENGTAINTNFEGGSLTGPSLSVAIDTFDNGGESGFQLEIHNNGSQVGTFDLNGLGTTEPDVYQVVMSFDGAGNLTVNVINTANLNQTGNQNYSVNLAGLDNATFGWSANTGGSTENHDIRTFSGTFVPEPTTAVLLGLGLAGLAYSGRRRA